MIDSGFFRGAYFRPGGYGPLLAPLRGYGERIEPLQAPFAQANESVTQAPDHPRSPHAEDDLMRDFRDAKAMALTLREALKAKSVSRGNSAMLLAMSSGAWSR